MSKNPIAGYTTYADPLGITIGDQGLTTEHFGNLITTSSNPNEGVTQPIQRAIQGFNFSLKVDANLGDKAKMVNLYNYVVFEPPVDPDLASSFYYGTNIKFNNEKLQKAIIDARLAEVKAAEREVEQNKAKNTCIQENINQIGQGAAKAFGSLLDAIVSMGVDFVVGKINESLPPYAQLKLSYKDGQIGSIGVGPASYDPTTGNVTVDSKVFSTAIDAGLSVVNKNLPSYMQLRSSDFGLLAQDLTINFDALAVNKDGELQATGPKPVGPGVTAEVKEDKTTKDKKVFIQYGNKEFDVGQVFLDAGGKVAGRVIDNGISSLNQTLPDYLQVSRSDQGVNIGPLTYDNATKSVTVNPDSLGDSLKTLVNPALNALPAPFGAAALLLWDAINPSQILANLLSGLGLPVKSTSRNYLKSACKGKSPATPQPYAPGTGQDQTNGPTEKDLLEDAPTDALADPLNDIPQEATPEPLWDAPEDAPSSSTSPEPLWDAPPESSTEPLW